MAQLFLALIQQLNSSVFILLGLTTLVGVFLFKTGKWTERFQHHDKRLSFVENLRDTVIKIETKVDLIYQNTNPRKVVAPGSPIALTSVGKEIVDKIKANTILEKYLSKLIKEVDLTNPQNAYDIQTAAMKASREELITFLNAEELNIVKQEAYSRGIIAEDVLSVVGVLLRDYILSQKGLPISDIDKHEKPGKS